LSVSQAYTAPPKKVVTLTSTAAKNLDEIETKK